MKHVHIILLSVLTILGTATVLAQQQMPARSMGSMSMMMSQMDSLMTAMHGMSPSGHHAMMGQSMNGMMGSSTAVDSLSRQMEMLGSNMQDTMAQMHRMMGDRSMMENTEHGQALTQMQSRMQMMMQAYQGMMDQMRQLRMGQNGGPSSSPQ